MPSGSRPSRIGDQLRVELSDLIARSLHDPGIGFLTITHVKVTPDLQMARVYYTTLGDEQARRESRRALERAAPFLRRQIGGRLRLRRVPQLEFFFDESIERGDRIERILQDLSSERAAAADDEEATSGETGVVEEAAHLDERQDDE
jgi:ribosome-binding factor A